MLRRVRWILGGLVCGVLAAAPAGALTLTLSDQSSEPATNPAGDLLADVTFSVSGCGGGSCTLTITLDNRTDENGSGVTYDINQLAFNASFATSGAADLTFVSAIKNGSTDITAGWTFSEQLSNPDANTQFDGFGVFDFSLMDGVGMSANMADPGDSIVFTFTAPDGTSDADFFQTSEQTPTMDQSLKVVSAKFVNMDPVGYSTCGSGGTGDCDSAYGGVPEPGLLTLLVLGTLGLGAFGRRRRA